MHVRTVSRRAVSRSDQSGVVAIVVALAVTSLVVVAAMVLDFGLVRVDRQVDKSAADAATLAGIAALGTGDDGVARPYSGVCAAVRYLAENNARFADVSETSGTWTTGTGASTVSGCTDSTLLDRTCVPGDKGTWAVFSWSGTWNGEPLKVQIQSGYQLAGSGWAEESLAALSADQADEAQGCDQLAVIITQNRKPGLGSLATSSDLVTAIRSVGRVAPGNGRDAPAMLLLKRTGCSSLELGSSGGGSWVRVLGDYSPTTHASQPGTIHADADGLNCSSSIFYGKAPNGIVAYAAPLASGQPDPDKPGQITSVGTTHQADSDSNVYASDQVNGTGGTHIPVGGRPLVTRLPVDYRYLETVRTAISGAQTTVFGSGLTAGNAASRGYDVATCSSNGTVTLPAQTQLNKLYVNCSTVTSSPMIHYRSVVFSGNISLSSGGLVAMPDADHVYVYGDSGDAISLSGSGALRIHAGSANVDPTGLCTSNVVAGSKAVVFVRNGDLKQNAGTLQLCNTTVFMMGGQPDGCLPASYAGIANARVSALTYCGGSTGNGQIKQTGGSVDWTAPNGLDKTMEPYGHSTPEAIAAWHDPNGPEDLALWDESGGDDASANTAYTMTGGGTFHLQGIFMVPNAEPFSLSGNSNLVLDNAQFVVSSLKLASNNTTLQMKVDPNAAVTIPDLHSVGLVR